MADKSPNLMTEMLEKTQNSTTGCLMTSIESEELETVIENSLNPKTVQFS
jgi:hypothetical protein